MKNLIAFAGLILLTVSAYSAELIYKCDTKIVTVKQNGDKYAVSMAFSSELTKNHKINILTDDMSLDQLTQTFSEGEMVVEGGLQDITGLAKGSLAFTGFHYPKGEMYVTAEGETNEEGYTFATESGLLTGEASVNVAEIFWSDFNDPQITKYSCSRIK